MKATAAIRDGLWVCLALVCLAFVAFPQWAGAQSLQLYSELAEIDSLGNVTAPENPREILSPMIVRGGFTSFQIVVQVKPGTAYGLHIGQNPEHAVEVKLYRRFHGALLENVELPFKGETTAIFWMDVWADRDAPVRRIKIEPQLHIEPQPGLTEDWLQYPMEARVMSAKIPEGTYTGKSPALPDRSDEILRGYLCGRAYEALPFSNPPSVSERRYRNILQDIALVETATKVADPAKRAAVLDGLKRMLGSCDAPPFNDPEAYLGIRDYLFRLP